MNSDWNRDYLRQRRARFIAQGLTAHGGERKSRHLYASASSDAYWQMIRRDGLEALTWMATKKWREPAYLLGLHAFATNLPLTWWHGKDNHSIAAVVDALERERRAQFEVPA